MVTGKTHEASPSIPSVSAACALPVPNDGLLGPLDGGGAIGEGAGGEGGEGDGAGGGGGGGGGEGGEKKVQLPSSTVASGAKFSAVGSMHPSTVYVHMLALSIVVSLA